MAYKLKIMNGALDELNGNIVLRGVIDQTCLPDIKVGPYQREEARGSHINKLVKALRAGERFPDIEIGIRGCNFREHKDGVFYIEHDCYVVDGFQRITASKRFLTEEDGRKVHLGALLHFGTDEAWERARFKTLNQERARVSPNVILRNEVHSLVVKALGAMSENDKEFVLRGKICWGQRMARGELLGALLTMKVAGVMHCHFGPGMSTRVEELVASMDKTFSVVGSNVWRANVREFFAVIDQAFGIRSIAFRDLSPHIKGGFMFTLARIFADHQTFWEDTRLVVARHDIDKLRSFPIKDPGIVDMIGSSGSKMNPLLYSRMIQHMNSGRRTRRLLKWNGQPTDGIPDLIGSAEESGMEPDADDGNQSHALVASSGM
jgi:hypothetical protein